MSIIAPVAIPPAGLPLPDPANRPTFSARMLEMLRWMTNELSTYMYNLGVSAHTNALDSQVSATSAADNATSAAASASSVSGLVNFKGNWSAQVGALNKPASVFHSGAYWMLLNNLADVTLSQPGVTADWQVAAGAFPRVRINTSQTAAPFTTYVIYGGCTLTMPAISGNGKQVGVVVLPGVTGAVFAPAGSDKTRGASGTQPIDAPFSAILTDNGATDGWI